MASQILPFAGEFVRLCFAVESFENFFLSCLSGLSNRRGHFLFFISTFSFHSFSLGAVQ